jgi:ADP-ribose pyrophosphatase YjhB (NUDIX family)
MFMIKCSFENGHPARLRHVTVDALIEHQGQILLVKRSTKYPVEPGKLALPGGYLERDESAAQAVVREVLEETGYQAQVISLFRIIDQPRLKGDDRQNVGFFFQVKVAKKVGTHDFEIDSVHWLPINQLPPWSEFAFDHGDNLKLFIKFLKKPFPLPVIN